MKKNFHQEVAKDAKVSALIYPPLVFFVVAVTFALN